MRRDSNTEKEKARAISLEHKLQTSDFKKTSTFLPFLFTINLIKLEKRNSGKVQIHIVCAGLTS